MITLGTAVWCEIFKVKYGREVKEENLALNVVSFSPSGGINQDGRELHSQGMLLKF